MRHRSDSKTKALWEKSHPVDRQWALQTERLEKTTGRGESRALALNDGRSKPCWKRQGSTFTRVPAGTKTPRSNTHLACSRTRKRAMWLGWSRWKVLQDKSLSHSPGKKAGGREDPDPVLLKREHWNVRVQAAGVQEGEWEQKEMGLRDDQDSRVGSTDDEELLEASAEMIYIFPWMCILLKTFQQVLWALP